MHHIACLKTGVFHGDWNSEKLHRGLYQHVQVHHTANVYILVNANNHWVLAWFFFLPVWAQYGLPHPQGGSIFCSSPSADLFVSWRYDIFDSGAYTTIWESFTRYTFVAGHFVLSSNGTLRCQEGRHIYGRLFISMDNEGTAFDVGANVAEYLTMWSDEEGQQELFAEGIRRVGAGRIFGLTGRGGLRQNTAVLYPTSYAVDDMFRPLWAIFRSQNVWTV